MTKIALFLLLIFSGCEMPNNYDAADNDTRYVYDKQTETCLVVFGAGNFAFAGNVDCNKLPMKTKIKFGLVNKGSCTTDMK